jgi:hypothetical protein
VSNAFTSLMDYMAATILDFRSLFQRSRKNGKGGFVREADESGF